MTLVRPVGIGRLEDVLWSRVVCTASETLPVVFHDISVFDRPGK